MEDPAGVNKSFSQIVDGFRIPGMISADVYRSALNYKPRDDDLFIATYPKCGTTWTQYILMLIFRQGKPIESMMQFFIGSPYLEFAGTQPVEQMPRPGAIKVHLPYHLTPRSDKAKYIYVARNPKDCCVSYYYHMKDMPVHVFDATFDEFYEMFISGIIDYEDYFDHLLGWYEHRNDPNVLFMTYEEMKVDPKAAILKMASFIDEEKYAEPLRRDPTKLNNIFHYSSFDYMKSFINKNVDQMMSMKPEDLKDSKDIPDSVKEVFLKIAEASELLKSKGMKMEGMPKSSNFVRKGIIGDWRNHFSEEQNRRMEEKFAERTKGTDIPDLWKGIM